MREYIGTVDFVRYVIPGHYENVMRDGALIADAATYEMERNNHKKASHIKTSDYHDRKRGCHVGIVEISGPVAGDVLQTFQTSYVQYISRLDWRVEDVDEPYSYAEMRRAMKSLASERNTFQELDSKERIKWSGRDAGGQSLYSGAAGSERRMVYYQRAKERAATECRFSGKEAQKVVRDAASRYASFNCASFFDCLTEALDAASHTLFEQRTGLSWLVVTGQEKRARQEPIGTIQQSLFDEVIELIGMMTPKTQFELFTAVSDSDNQPFMDAAFQATEGVTPLGDYS